MAIELQAVLAVTLGSRGGTELLRRLAVEMVSPIEGELRKREPGHPGLALLDESRAADGAKETEPETKPG